MKIQTQEIEVGQRQLKLEHGKFAEQANSAILARYGDTMVLVTVVASPLKVDLDYFPLTVDYLERLYAGGRIKGSRWVKREGRPTDEEILSARLVDRSIRPLFPKNYKKEVQVMVTVLSVDGENDPRIISIVAASAALTTSNIPWNGPVGALRIGSKKGSYFVNPTDSGVEFSDLDLVMVCGRENILMIEAAAREVPEENILGALSFGGEEIKKIITGIDELAKKVGVQKDKVEEVKDREIIKFIDKKFAEEIDRFVKLGVARETGALSSEIKAAIIEEVGSEKSHLVPGAFEEVLRKRIREGILKGRRVDGRKNDEIREISGEVGILPRTHGSAVFRRGQTQVLAATTLGSPSMEQLIESAEGEETKSFIHHYSMPPYSIGETGRVGYPSRRDIGHGALVERAILPVIPPQESFPYTIRVVSEVMSSNGSTSMASVCGSTMSLMDAGVPISTPVSGIAMGLVIDAKEVAVLSDIVGAEDGAGDMDFKVAGTKKGVTALQLDVKTQNLTSGILERALVQAKEGRLFILGKMLEVIDEPRSKISEHAPKIALVKIPTEKIGELIGPGGKVIRKLMLETGVQIDVEDDGSVTIAGITQESVDKARVWIEGLTREVKAGDRYEGVVKRIQPFGAFVEILPGKEGLVHISDLSDQYVTDPREVVSEGQKVEVWVKEIDDLARINLSIRGADKPKILGRRNFAPRKESRAPHFPPSRYLTKGRR